MGGFVSRSGAYFGRPFVPGWRTTIGDLVLITVFAMLSSLDVMKSVVNWALGWDARICTHAARALVEGGDAWGWNAASAVFVGPPIHLLPFVPFIWLPDPVLIGVWTAIPAASAIYILRKLNLPFWWLAFPPVVVAILAGSSALPVTALVLRGGTLAEGAAAAFRIYIAVPLLILGRWRALVVAAGIVVLTAPLLDWPGFFNSLGFATALLEDQTKGGKSAAALPVLIPIAVACLFLLGRRRAAWLAVPALWPYTQNYYAVLALPIVASAPLVALTLAVDNIKGFVVVGLVAQVAVEWRTGRLNVREALDSWLPERARARVGLPLHASPAGLRAAAEPPPSADPG